MRLQGKQSRSELDDELSVRGSSTISYHKGLRKNYVADTKEPNFSER